MSGSFYDDITPLFVFGLFGLLGEGMGLFLAFVLRRRRRATG
jgi:hypothetical protein